MYIETPGICHSENAVSNVERSGIVSLDQSKFGEAEERISHRKNVVT